ncbi:Uncharacterised protein [Bordetella pertussis]|nr:Uncharacterised protein [Bordetella pertussis]CPO34198.1 Uncharacterised protein [Bordetella pertussis]
MVMAWRLYSSTWSCGKLALRTTSSTSAITSGRFLPSVEMLTTRLVPLPLMVASACS